MVKRALILLAALISATVMVKGWWYNDKIGAGWSFIPVNGRVPAAQSYIGLHPCVDPWRR